MSLTSCHRPGWSQCPALLENRPRVGIIACYRILPTQNEGGPAHLPIRHPLGALDGGLTGGCFGNSPILGSRCSKADSYHFNIASTPSMILEDGRGRTLCIIPCGYIGALSATSCLLRASEEIEVRVGQSTFP